MKPFMLVPALVAVFVVAWPANGDAQYRGHYGGRVVVAAPYYPYYPFALGMGWGYGPWYPYPYYPYPVVNPLLTFGVGVACGMA